MEFPPVSLNVSCPIWDYDDMPDCQREQLLQTIWPTAIGAFTLLWAVIQTISSSRSSKVRIKPNLEQQPLLGTADEPAFDDAQQDYGSIKHNPGLSLAEQHFDVTRIEPTRPDGSPIGFQKLVPRSLSDTIRTIVEIIALAAQLGLAVSALIVPDIAAEWSGSYAPLVGVAVWGYLFAIGLVKTLGATTSLGDRLPNYWLPTTIFYILNWPASALMFRSALLGHTAIPQFYIAQFILSTLLVYCAVTIRIVGKYGKIYVTDALSIPSPEPVSSLFDIFSYSWVDKLIWNSYYTPLTKESLWGLRRENYAYYVIHGFHSMTSAGNLTSKLYRYFGPTVLMQSFWTTLDSFLVFAPTVFLRYILEYVAHPEDTPKSVAWFYVFAMFFFSVGSACASGRALFLGRKICVNMKAVVIGEVYAKALRRRVTAPTEEDGEEKEGSGESSAKSPEAKKSADLGAIINLMAVDAFRIADICAYLHYFVSSLVMVVVAMYLLYNLLGWSAIAGSLSFVVMTPINYYFTRKMAGYEKDILSYTDKRIQRLNETFQSIRIVKFFAWEEKFVQQIMELRNTELKLLLTRLMMWVLASAVYYVTPTLVTVISFYCYTQIEHKVLTTPVAFTALSLFSLLRSPLENFADMLAYVIQSKVSLDRVQEFLDEEDCDKYEQLSSPRTPDCPLVGFKNATMAWSTNSKSDFRLRDVDVAFEEGQLNVIIGPTGSGKTSLLLGLLGEMNLIQGQVFLPGSALKDTLKPDPVTGLTESVAYCSQSAWLLNATIKDNILFANPYEPIRYQKVIEACGLKRDFEILSAGDQTEIGEKGIALSGGQKQRVSLARALYSKAKYVLLDDCLSAVDSHTSSHIYENCITGELMKQRTCILVSHNIALTMQQASYVVVMENGRVKAQGTPEKLFDEGHLGDDEMVKTSVMGSRAASSTQLSSLGNALDVEEVGKKIAEEELEEQPLKETTDGKLVEEESKSEGAVAWIVYKRYFIVFGGYLFTTFVLSSLLLNQFVYFLQSYWLRIWALAEDSRTVLMVTTAVSEVSHLAGTVSNYMSNLLVGTATAMDLDWHKPLGGEAFRIVSKEEHSTLFYIYIYAAIGICFTTVSALRIAFVSWGGVRASRQMFETLLRVTMRAKLRFFDSTPVGRIMNRFSKDIEEVDQHLSPIADAFLMSVVSCLWTLGVICIVTPSFVFFGIFISLSYYAIGIFYTYASRELKRFESISRSPIHQLFTETLVGVTTIRAYGDERRFMKQILAAVDGSNKPFYYLWIANRWLAFRSDLLGAGISFFASAFVLMSSDYIDAGMAGISLSYAISFTQSSLWVVRLYANIEMSMNAVERIQEYSDLEQEPPAEIPETQPPSSWPANGAIEVKDVSLRYAPQLPLVIKNVTFDVKPNMKVGIVGRTGAGKSTIITAFFRFLDPETGYIKVDGIDITTIGLKTLRQAITIIPQDPTLFTGTIRSNLDPFGKYTDLDMFEALRRVSLVTQAELTDALNSTAGITSSSAVTENKNKFLSLDSKITEGGSNLSQGQRQLVCLARSLLMAPKVILLDEATASIDYKSDAQIQNTIRQEFSQSTILTIAHRLRSIIDYDKILVMDAGEVIEYADPYTLIIDKNSQFRSLCNDSGELDTLIQLAKESFVARKAKK